MRCMLVIYLNDIKGNLCITVIYGCVLAEQYSNNISREAMFLVFHVTLIKCDRNLNFILSSTL